MSYEFSKGINNDKFSNDLEKIVQLEIANRMVTEAKSLAPVDKGRLRNSIRYWEEANTILVGSDVLYAIYQEFGTRYMSPQPFLQPAAHIVENPSISLAGINKFMGKLQTTWKTEVKK